MYGIEGRWIQGTWTPDQVPLSVEFKELFAILMACATWGHLWRRQCILVHCDNQAIVSCMSSGTSKSASVMLLLRNLFYVSALHSFTVTVKHVAGKSNCIADSLSRFHMQEFRKLAPRARPTADSVPHLMLED